MTDTLANLEELLQEREWRRCAPDWDTSTTAQKIEAFTYFVTNYWYIRGPKKRMKLNMRDAQRETIAVWISERYSIALKARQVGFSTLAGAYAFWLTFFYPDRAVIMISKGEREASSLLTKSRYGYRFLPEWMRLRGPIVSSNQTKMSMTNESYIVSVPSAADPARGETAFLVIVDEMGQLPNSDEAWASIEPVADQGGSVIMLGTANGEGNLFHKLWVNAKSPWGTGVNRFVGIFHSWRAGGRDDAWYEQQKRELPEWQLAQEYPDNPDEAFLKSGRPVFNLVALRALELEQPEARGYMRRNPHTGLVEFREEQNGPLRVYRMPVEKHRYCLGVDVAEGLEHGDYSSIHVIDANTREVVAHYHDHIVPDLLGSDVVPLLGAWYNQALVLVESNNHGLTTLTELQRLRYSPLFRRRRVGSRTKPVTEALGWATTAPTKRLAVDELDKAIRDPDGISLYDSETVAEMRSFVRDGNGKMHGSPHDDRVMSLAIANQGLQYVYLKEYAQAEKPGPGTFGWWMNQKELWDDDDDAPSFIGGTASRAS